MFSHHPTKVSAAVLCALAVSVGAGAVSAQTRYRGSEARQAPWRLPRQWRRAGDIRPDPNACDPEATDPASPSTEGRGRPIPIQLRMHEAKLRRKTMLRKRLTAVSAAVLCALAVSFGAGAASAQTKYKVIDMSIPFTLGSEIDGVRAGHSVGFENTGSGIFRGRPFGAQHAVLWRTPGAIPIQLHPDGWISSAAEAINGGRQVGFVLTVFEKRFFQAHAAVWAGSVASFVDINPPEFYWTQATGIDGTQVVGYAIPSIPQGTIQRALLWDLVTGIHTDLTPARHQRSMANGVFGGEQVGWAQQGGPTHAALWKGSAASAVDLNPTGVQFSIAYATDGKHQVGIADDHATLWTGSAASAVDLNPAGWASSAARAVLGSQEVGDGQRKANVFISHALIWSGTAASVVDLHRFLPAGFTESFARAVDARGNVGGSATDSAGTSHAILWQPIP
jgi:hypothetical protein